MHWHLLAIDIVFNEVIPANVFVRFEENSDDTLPETNVAPENGWLEDYFPIGEAYFQGLCQFQGGQFNPTSLDQTKNQCERYTFMHFRCLNIVYLLRKAKVPSLSFQPSYIEPCILCLIAGYLCFVVIN